MYEQTKKIVEKFLSQTKGGIEVGQGNEEIKYRLNFLRAQDGNEWNNHIVLDIPDMDLFIKKVARYFMFSQGLFRDEKRKYDLTYEAYLERLFVSLMANMTYADAHNVYNYIDMRANLYVDVYDQDEIIGELGYVKGAQNKTCQAGIVIDRLSSMMEAPYSFTPNFIDGQNEFFLPSITFGIVKDTAYVYAVQNRCKGQSNPLQKDLDRYFRKVGKDVKGEEELMQVSPNALVSMTMFVSYLRGQGVKRIVARDFQPARYQSNESRIAEKKESDVKQKQQEVLDQDQFNITNKFMYLFLRYNYHFPACTCDYDIDQGQMIMNIKEGPANENNIIYDIDKIPQRSKSQELLVESEL